MSIQRKVAVTLAVSFLLACVVSFQNCSAGFQVTTGLDQSSLGGGNGPITADDASLLALGKTVYTNNCAACHGSLFNSQKLNRSAAAITASLSSVPQMGYLKGILSTKEIDAVARALFQPTTSNPFQCTPGSLPSADSLHRLSKAEYTNTLGDLFNGAIALSEISSELGNFPAEVGEKENPFDRASKGMTTGIFNAHDGVAKRIGQIIGSDATKRGRIFSEACFSQATVTDACLNSFLDRFGKQVYRRPVTSAERTPLIKAYRVGANHAEGASYLTRALLLSPTFLYHTEFGGSPVSGRNDLLALNAYEVASRLSYLVTGSMPDATLMATADNGGILQSDIFNNQMTRLLGSARAKSSIRRFYHKMLVLDSLRVPSYSNAFRGNINTANLNAEAEEEVLSFTDYITFENRPVREFLTSKVAFVKSDALAAIYGITKPTTGDGRTSLPANRSGILSRAALLLSGSDDTAPIHRGAIVRASILCDEIPSPNPAALPEGSLELPVADHRLTTRERWTNKTSAPACIACHSKINPLGFVLEAYDGLGRYRTQEIIRDASGNVVASLPLNTRDIPNIENTNESAVNDGLELSDAIAKSQKFPACFARKFHQFAMRRTAQSEDGCAMASLYETLASGNGTPMDMMKALISHPNFRQRRLPQ